MMSRIAPRVHRTSFVSAGGNWKCMPRTVPCHVIEGDVGLGDDRLQAMVGQLVLAESSGEIAARVLPALQVDEKGARELGFGEDHVPPPRSTQARTAPTGVRHRNSVSSRPSSRRVFSRESRTNRSPENIASSIPASR